MSGFSAWMMKHPLQTVPYVPVLRILVMPSSVVFLYPLVTGTVILFILFKVFDIGSGSSFGAAELIGIMGERHEKIVLFEPSTNQFGYVTRGYPITHATLKIGCKGSQWVVCIATPVNPVVSEGGPMRYVAII